jgi:hypothetical protein
MMQAGEGGDREIGSGGLAGDRMIGIIIGKELRCKKGFGVALGGS